ncbi:MAG: DUF362 domain-containing protein [bacterium]|nr:DUF362 domain-containing protein [bacterium]
MGKKISRKQFLKEAAGLSVAAVGFTQLPISALAREVNSKSPKNNGLSRVVNIRNQAVQAEDGTVNRSVLAQMVNQGMVHLTGKKSSGDAWKMYFKPTDVVGIKVNCIAGKNMSTRPELVDEIISGLKSAGVKEDNIIIWERTTHELKGVGYIINKDAAGVKCYGTDGNYDEKPTQQGSVNGKLSRILSEKITTLINVPILKDHGAAGVTIAMKNHYGSIHNPGEYHRTNCDPYCADLNAIPEIKNKTRLIICDAIRALANGGPGDRPKYRFNYQGILFSTDPVAIDYQGWQIIEAQRKEFGLPTLTEQGRPPKYIETAAKLGLGTNDPSKMQVIQV